MFNWSLSNREKITEMVQKESQSYDVIHKILSWGVPVDSVKYSNYESSISFQASNNFFIVLIKYKGNLRHEVISSGDSHDEDLTEKVLESFRKKYVKKICDLKAFVDNSRYGFSPIRPKEDDLDMIQYICEYITSEKVYDKIFWIESIYSNKLFKNYIFIFRKNYYEIPIEWHELLFYHLPQWKENMTDDIYDEFLKLQSKYKNLSYNNRIDLQNSYTTKG